MKNEYYGVYDQKESDTFRPTIEKRIHKDYPVSKTLATREDSCCVIERERESNLRIRKLTPKEIIFYLMGLCGIIENIKGEIYEKRIRKILRILWCEIGKKEIQWSIRRFWIIQEKEILQPRMYEKSIFESWYKQPDKKTSPFFCSKNCQEPFASSKCLFYLWEGWKSRYTPQRWELSQQQFRQFNFFVSQLPHEDTQKEESMCDLWRADESTRILQQALYEIQEIWESVMYKEQNNLRIRKLTPAEYMKLMGFTDEDTNAMYEAGMSDAQIYHCAGDSLITTLFGALVGTMIHDETKLKKLLEEYIERIKNG